MRCAGWWTRGSLWRTRGRLSGFEGRSRGRAGGKPTAAGCRAGAPANPTAVLPVPPSASRAGQQDMRALPPVPARRQTEAPGSGGTGRHLHKLHVQASNARQKDLRPLPCSRRQSGTAQAAAAGRYPLLQMLQAPARRGDKDLCAVPEGIQGLVASVGAGGIVTQRFGGGSWFITLSGFGQLLQAFDDMEAKARALRGDTWIVGSVDEASRHIEWGDRRFPGRAILERSIRYVAAQIQASPDARATLARGLIVEDREILGTVARAIRDKAIALTVETGSVDEGDLAKSWRARRQ